MLGMFGKICFVGLLFTFVSCAPKNYKHSVMPKKEGISVTITAASETIALEGAKREAKEYCEQQSKGYIVVSGPETSYQGPSRDGAAGVAGQAVALFGGRRDKSEDYRCELVFECQ